MKFDGNYCIACKTPLPDGVMPLDELPDHKCPTCGARHAVLGHRSDPDIHSPYASKWEVRRWPRANAPNGRTVYAGTRMDAEAKYEEVARDLRQGMVALLDPSGVTVRRQSAPNLRTKW